MTSSIERQQRCAVYVMDELSESKPGLTEQMVCYRGDCFVVAELCVDGVTKVTGGRCPTLNQGSVFHGNFRKPPTENVV